MKYIAAIASVLIILYDVVLRGITCLALLCPLWFAIIFVRDFMKRTGWLATGLHCAVPALVMATSVLNSGTQERLAIRNTELISSSCCQFLLTHGRWPHSLDELVPEYFGNVPRAKHRFYGESGKFKYLPGDDGMSPCLFRLNRIGLGHLTTIKCEAKKDR